jgi:hypothetical protein
MRDETTISFIDIAVKHQIETTGFSGVGLFGMLTWPE